MLSSRLGHTTPWSSYPEEANPTEAPRPPPAETMTDAASPTEPVFWCSIITVTYNSAHTLKHFWIPQNRSDGVEWIVVDNGSTDDTVETAMELGATVISLDRNHGFSYANNVGYRAAVSDFVGFINPDVRLDVGALHMLKEASVKNNAVVGPQLYNPDGSQQPNGRGFPTLTAKVRNRLKGGDPFYLLQGRGKLPRPVVWLMGAAVLGHRTQFDSFGVWDSRFFLYYEDSDLGLRSWKAGVPVLLIAEAGMEHGWARETDGKFRFIPWAREIASLVKFYLRYPSLLGTRRRASRVFHDISKAVFENESVR